MTKTNIRKRAISILLILMVMLTMTPMTASAAEPEWTTVNSYEELQTAVKAKKEYIKLGQDIDTTNFHSTGSGLEVEDWLTFENQTCTLDLNGKTLTLMTRLLTMGVFLRVYDGSNLTIKDSSSAKTGAITGAFKNYIASDAGCCLFHVHGGSSLTLENGSFTVTSEPHESNADTVRAMDSNITIKEGVTISHPGKFYPEHSYKVLDGNSYALRTDGKCKVIIDGGVFDGHVKLSGYQDTNGSVQINKGTFKKDVQVLYTAEENNSNPAVTVNGGTFEGNAYLQYWPWKTSLYMPYRLNGGTFKGTVDLYADDGIYEKDKPTGNPNIAMGLDKCFGYSAVVTQDAVFTGPNAYTAVLSEKLTADHYEYYKMWLKGTASNPVRIIPNAWGMKSVTLDGNPIDYAKDWNGGFEELNNDEAHTLKFTWKPLAQELKDAGYSYNATCDRYISGSTTPTPDAINAADTEYSFTIPVGAPAKVYSFALHLNLKKSGSPYNVGIYGNEHIVKLVVNEAPVVEPDPTIEGSVYYTSSIVYDRPISTAVGNLPAGFDNSKLCYQWQRSTNGGSTWENIDGATKGSYTPVAADMGDTVRIRVKVTAEGYLGEIVGAALKVSKAANDNTPAQPEVVAQKDNSNAYTKFEITNFNSDQEYVYTTSAPTSGNEWPTGGTKINSATMTGLTAGSTYYIFTRYKETATNMAGSKIRSSSVLMDEITKLNRIILTDANGKVYASYGSGNTIYIQKGESMNLTATTNPSGANTWSAFTFKSQYGASAPFTVTSSTGPVTSGSPIPSVTIHGDNAGTGTLAAEYSGYTPQYYGTWRVHVYENVSDIGTGAEITVSSSFPDMTMYQGETLPLPEHNVSVYPEGALDNYDLAWRIIKVGISGAAYSESDENITLENGEIKATKAHTEPDKTRLVLVAVNKTNTSDVRSLSPSAGFYITVTAAPIIELTGVTVAPTKVNLDLNATYQLTAVKQPVNAAGNLSWESSNTGVATVDSTGKVTAKAQGTAIITVSCGDKKDTCTVTVAHTHDTDSQTWAPLNDNEHFRSCTAGDDFKMEAHVFSTWTKVDENTHKGICSKCSYAKTENHSWVFDHEDAPTVTTEGTRYYKCSATGCTATKTESIPVLTEYSITVSNDGNGTATASLAKAPAGTAITLTATPNAGYHFKAWKVVSGGVTITGNKFTMLNDNVEIKAIFEKNASSGGYVPTVQKPEITIIGSGKADLSADGRTATITADAGHELVSVVLNGKEMGKVEKLTGLKTGDKATITFQAKTDGKAEMDKMIAQKASKLKLMARSAKTAKLNIKVVVKGDLKAIIDAGYTVKYKFYRSTKKSAGYKAVLTKKAPTYFNTYGKQGTMYYYKARVMIYDKNGNFVVQTALKQCKYANRLWTK